MPSRCSAPAVSCTACRRPNAFINSSPVKGSPSWGLHTVFEHHEGMQPVSLQAFLHEFRVTHPVGVDAATPGKRIPATMQV